MIATLSHSLKGLGMKIKGISFKGMHALQIKKGGIEITVLTEMGPRIVELRRPGGKNLLFWDSEGKHYRGKWYLRGGHRVWITRPGAGETEESYAADNDECKITEESPKKATIMGQKDLNFGIRRGITIEENKHPNSLDIVNILVNESDMLWSGGLWSLTCTDPDGKTYAIPLGSGGQDDTWDGFLIYTPKRWAGHTSMVNDPQLVMTEDLLIINPRGTESKREVQAFQGWIGCHAPDEGCLFFKMMKYDQVRAAHYPDMCNTAYYIGPENFMVEMELMGPQQTVKPYQRICMRERWVLTDQTAWDNFKLIRERLRNYSL